jgi:SAM-dependent methyltransferase
VNREEVVRYFDQRLAAHGPTVQAVDWGSPASQRARFEVLAAVGPLAGSRVLDVGCGLGDLWPYLQSVAPSAQYEGWDLNPRMVAAAAARFPGVTFRAQDVTAADAPAERFDWVLASGLFYLRDETFLAAAVERLFARCRRGVAFNTLSAWAERQTPGELYAEPARVLETCGRLTPRVTLRHDYLPHDFTVYLYRDA